MHAFALHHCLSFGPFLLVIALCREALPYAVCYRLLPWRVARVQSPLDFACPLMTCPCIWAILFLNVALSFHDLPLHVAIVTASASAHLCVGRSPTAITHLLVALTHVCYEHLFSRFCCLPFAFCLLPLALHNWYLHVLV